MELFQSHITSATKLVFLSHVTSVNGLVLPVAEICKLARKTGAITIIDGAHGPGAIALNLEEVEPDFYFANCHKWMMGAIGSAFLYFGKDWGLRLRPMIANQFYPVAEEVALKPLMEFGPTHLAYAMEYQGTEDRSAQAVIHHAIAFKQKWGNSHLIAKAMQMRQTLKERLSNLGYKQLSLDHPQLKSNLISFQIPKVDATKAILDFRKKHHIDLQVPYTGAPHSILRLSAAWFNTDEQVERLTTCLKSTNWQEFA